MSNSYAWLSSGSSAGGSPAAVAAAEGTHPAEGIHPAGGIHPAEDIHPAEGSPAGGCSPAAPHRRHLNKHASLRHFSQTDQSLLLLIHHVVYIQC